LIGAVPLRALAWGLTGVAALAAGVALARADVDGGVTICMLRRLFDLPCPGCGMTRAFAALARGDLATALAFHPWAPAVAAQAGAAWLAWGASLAGAAPAAVRRVRPAALAAANLTVLAALWLGRLATGTLPY
jgi:hypothetical protein